MAIFLQELVNGITTGALYALMALSLTMVYGVLKLLNFAQTPAAGASSSNCSPEMNGTPESGGQVRQVIGARGSGV